jgi:hypothetical protein
MSEKDDALVSLAGAADGFIAAMRGVRPADYLQSPSPGRWSLAQNAEHTTVVIRGVERLFTTRLLAQPLATDDPARRIRDADLPRLLENRERAIDAPEMVRPKSRWTTFEEMAEALRTTVRGLSEWGMGVTADLRGYGYPHPLFGPMDGIQWLRFLAIHTDRHARQAEEILGQLRKLG